MSGVRLDASGAASRGRPVLRRVLQLFRPYVWSTVLLIVLIVVQAVVGVLSPFFLRQIVDKALPRKDLDLLTWLALGMIMSSVVSGSLSVVSNRLSMVVGQRVLNDLRVQVFEHLQHMS